MKPNPPYSRVSGAQRKTEIVDTALQVFGQMGLEKGTLDDIAGTLGITRQALYYYFKSKADIVAVCMEQGNKIWEENHQAWTSTDRLAIDRLGDVFLNIADWRRGPFGKFWASCTKVIHEDTEIAELVRKYRVHRVNLISLIVQQGIDDGSIIPCDSQIAARTFWGCASWFAFADKSEFTDEEVQGSLDIFLRGIRND